MSARDYADNTHSAYAHTVRMSGGKHHRTLKRNARKLVVERTVPERLSLAHYASAQQHVIDAATLNTVHVLDAERSAQQQRRSQRYDYAAQRISAHADVFDYAYHVIPFSSDATYIRHSSNSEIAWSIVTDETSQSS